MTMGRTGLIHLLLIAVTTIAVVKAAYNESVISNDERDPVGESITDPLERLMRSIKAQELVNPGLFESKDLNEFLSNHGPLAAYRFLNQRMGNSRRASRLAHNVLKWRKTMKINHVDASSFPCDLFAMGLIFEYGRAHSQLPTGEYVETNPVIWIRLGALGSIVKQLERFTPERVTSYGVNAPRKAWHRLRDAVSSTKERRYRMSNRDRRVAERAAKGPLMKDLSARENDTLLHVLRAIAWWLDDWARRHPEGSHATLVLDFENTDFAFASWSLGEFLMKLDDMFPDLFDRIIGYRYKAKMWSLHTPISMFNRIFKSRVSSSPETDQKLRFVGEAHQISAYVPRVDEHRMSLLPEHVSGVCMAPDNSKAPTGCKPSVSEAGGALFDPNLWKAIYNEFYYKCTPLERNHG